MRYEILPVRVRGPRAAVGVALRIETPSQPTNDLEIQQLFQECGSDLERRREVRGSGIWNITIALSSTEGLVPPNPGFLEALCGFLSEHPFDVGAGNAIGRELRLEVRVDIDPATARSEDDEGIFEEATSRICGAFWQNDNLRSAFTKIMDVPYVLRQDVIDRVLLDIRQDDFSVIPPLFRATLIARDLRADARDVLQVDVAGVGLAAVGAAYAAVVMDRALNLFRPEVVDPVRLRHPPRFVVASDRTASIVDRRLQQYQRGPTPLSSIDLVMGNRRNLAMLGVDAPRLNGVSMIRGVLMKCTSLTVEGFRLSGDLSSAPVVDADDRNVPEEPSLWCLTLHGCEFSDPVGGAGAFWSFLQSQGVALTVLQIFDTPIPLDEMSALCRALAARYDTPRRLHLGNAPSFHKKAPCLGDESVRLFFEALPTLESLLSVVFYHKVPAHLSKTVVDGVKDNHWLRQLDGLSFEVDEEVDDDDDDEEEEEEDEREASASCLRNEIKAYLTANARGRGTVYGAVLAMAGATAADPDLRRIQQELVAEALQVLERLAASEEDMDDETTRFLCLRLFLPALGGGGAAIP